MRTVRRTRPLRREARAITLWMQREAWECLNHIAERSECSVAEVIEMALDDWADGANLALEVLGPDVVKGVGHFDVVPEVR